MLLSFVISAILLSALIAARYFLVAGFFHWLVWSNGGRSDWARRLARRKPSPKMMRHERNWSLVASGIYGVAGAIVFVAWEAGGTALYTNLTAADIWYIPLSIGLCLFIHDTWFYWTHRVMHHPRLFAATHRTHHISHDPSPWAAFSFSPWESLSGAILLPAVAFFLPLHLGAVFFVLAVMTLASVLNHLGWEIFPDSWIAGRFGRIFITATHHTVHHHDYGANFGLYFRFWDRVMGTDVLEAHYPHLQSATGGDPQPTVAPGE